MTREEEPERFLEVYLSVLYPHPTDELVGLFADKALRASRFLGREPEVLKAFEYVISIHTASMVHAIMPRERIVGKVIGSWRW